MPETDPMETAAATITQIADLLDGYAQACVGGAVMYPGDIAGYGERVRDALAALRLQLTEAQADTVAVDQAADDLFEERGRLREALFFFASVIRSGESWTEHCDAALARATAPLGAARLASSSEPPPTTETPE